MNPVKQIGTCGQSIWLDFLSRDLIESGSLRRLIGEDGISGITTNPSIFEKAVRGGSRYDALIGKLAESGCSSRDIYRHLVLRDVADAADLLRPVHEKTGGRDGFVSLEVSPHLAHDSEATVAEARSLWQALQRPNVLIKVPATAAGLAAVRRLIAGGVNVNVTLLFGLERYRQVQDAWLAGLEDRRAAGRSVEHAPVSVASFFLSRIDTLVDALLEQQAENTGDAAAMLRLRGETAIACAHLAYDSWRRLIAGGRFRTLAGHGAGPQRLLWASTSTKNPAYPDVKYVEALIGPDTVNTLPLETLQAYRDHGAPAVRLTGAADPARALLDELQRHGIDLQAVAAQLEREGVRKFADAYDQLLDGLEQKCTEISI